MDSRLLEGYEYAGQRFALRRDFYRDGKKESLRPSFFAEPVPESPTLSLFAAIEARLRREAATGRPLYLLYSGGVDSELILDVARRLDLPITAVVVDLFGMNRYELSFARRYLTQHRLPVINLEISRAEFFARWLPEFIFDCESLAFLAVGAYAAARQVPRDALILTSGENPDVLSYDRGNWYLVRHEYSFWLRKLAARRDLQSCALLEDPAVLRSYLNYPALRERRESAVPFETWTADHEALAKEFIYTDPDFRHLERRYAQHGWEGGVHAFAYQKGMRQGLYIKGQDGPPPLFHGDAALALLLEFLRTDRFDATAARRALVEGEIIAPLGSARASDFNLRYYVPLNSSEAISTTWDGQIKSSLRA